MSRIVTKLSMNIMPLKARLASKFPYNKQNQHGEDAKLCDGGTTATLNTPSCPSVVCGNRFFKDMQLFFKDGFCNVQLQHGGRTQNFFYM